jgi:excisionase family DNA binding protein
MTADKARRGGVSTYSVIEAQRKLGIGKNAIYYAIHSGQIRAIRIGKTLRISKSWLDSLLAEGTNIFHPK